MKNKEAPETCSRCDGQNIDWGQPDMNKKGQLTIDATCIDCDNFWIDVYFYAGSEET